MRPSLRCHLVRLVVGLLLSQGALDMVRADDPPTKWSWGEGRMTWPGSGVAAPSVPADVTGPAAVKAMPATIAPPFPDSLIVAPNLQLPQPPGAPPIMPGQAPPPPAPEHPACSAEWLQVPPVTPMPRTGVFLIPPGGPGYYSVLDLLTRHDWPDRPKQPYGPFSICGFSFFDADFRYLDDPNNTQTDWLDWLKRIHPTDDFLLSLGGEYRYRFMAEYDSRLSGKNNFYNLLRERFYADIWWRDRVRLYAEFIGAQDYGYTLPPLAIDRNQADLLNLFTDVKVLEEAGAPVTVRVGRQELLYGSQRLISPLDWANTRRTFQGVKGFWHGEDWNIDAFWVKPVIVNPIDIDNWDRNQNFSGGWITWKPKKGTTVDLYVLNLNNGAQTFTGRNGIKGGLDITTFGTRTAGDYDGRFLWDFEGMVQTGIRANQEVVAGAYTVSAGYCAKNLPWVPTFWAVNDWASGNQNPGGPGTFSTFNQLFPFGHFYFGFIDFVGRQNINDFNLQLSVCPTRWLTALLQFHDFSLVSAKDALYSAGGAVLRVSPTGTAGRFVGDELDFVANVHLTQHQDWLVGYSRFFSGEFIHNTGNPLSASLFYTQYSYKW